MSKPLNTLREAHEKAQPHGGHDLPHDDAIEVGRLIQKAIIQLNLNVHAAMHRIYGTEVPPTRDAEILKEIERRENKVVHTCTIVLTVVGNKDEALTACADRGLHPWDDTVIQQDDGTCLVESPLQESALEKASAWFWEDYYEPHPVGTLVAISADSRRPIVREVTP